MIEKNKETQSQSLAELQQELKSLKALLLTRGPSAPSTPLIPTGGRPSIPAWQLATAPAPSAAGSTQLPKPADNGKGKEAEVPLAQVPTP